MQPGKFFEYRIPNESLDITGKTYHVYRSVNTPPLITRNYQQLYNLIGREILKWKNTKFSGSQKSVHISFVMATSMFETIICVCKCIFLCVKCTYLKYITKILTNHIVSVIDVVCSVHCCRSTRQDLGRICEWHCLCLTATYVD